ncbi:NadS family protein [Rhizosaccharibacter radicis]|uniref:Helix-turn-helix domain-containing protein n=1 Tax=Rhizosaccharibacter radicis TaxID=2782605 RepID=A0ABT1VXJ5_9PROT|nr:helix-turn-helix domain-containing protein [Acetobacteraceae bacterium KSS12]
MSERIDITDELIASLQEAGEILSGTKAPARAWTPPADVDVKAIRARRGLSQVAFARRYGFSPDAVRDWEQGRRRPEQAARTLLLVIDKEPEAVERVLAVA